ncbi:MAG: ribonuclease HI [Syntrophaceae bacterium]|nr:ribonuclease HI [Syntrophaceae bacterium]
MVPNRNSVTIFTDGACLGNPGPGGWGVVLLSGSHRKELSGGCRLTTNNRMELQAAIQGLQALKKPCEGTLITDSQYVFNGIDKGWARRWKEKNWMRTRREKAQNADLWQELLDLCERHRVRFQWVRGHAGNVENERCDRLAQEAARLPNLPPDPGYRP